MNSYRERFWNPIEAQQSVRTLQKVASFIARSELGFGETSYGGHMRLNWRRAFWGALIEVVLGTLLAEDRVRHLAAEQGLVAPTGSICGPSHRF
jgi:hypothetical protein